MFNRMKLASKVLVPAFLLCSVMLILLTAALWLQKNVADINRQAADASAQAIEASEVRALSRAIQRDALKLTLENWIDERKSLDDSVNSRSQELLTRAHKVAEMVDPNNTEMTHNFVGLQETVVKEVGLAKAAALAGRFEEAKDSFRKRVQPAERAASQLTDAFVEATEKAAQDLTAEAKRVELSTALTLLALCLVGLFVGLGAATAIARRGIILPLRRIISAMVRLSAGDLGSAIDGVERKDEIGEMAKALLVFRDAAVENARLEREAAEHRAQAERERERNEQAQREAIEQERAIVADSIGVGLTRLAAKDLTYRMSSAIPEAYRKLQTDFNAAIAQLEEAMHAVTDSTHAIHAGTEQISTAADEMALRTEQQAASLEETAASVEEITSTVNKSAEGAVHARQVVAAADEDAKKSTLVVRQAVEAMNAIEKSAQQISQIIGVIDEIAFQTNLLALNAGVEAARAGDAGRGFAVVASEVRALAQRSAEAAKQIKGLITASARQVEDGVKLVDATGKSLERIMGQVTEINSIVSEIAEGAKEQATGISEVNTAVSQMDQMTQRNSAMVEESTAATHSLSKETALLSDLIGQFQLSQTESSASMRRELEKVAPHAFRQPPKVAAPKGALAASKTAAQPVRTAPKAKVANGAAVDVGEGSWKEF